MYPLKFEKQPSRRDRLLCFSLCFSYCNSRTYVVPSSSGSLFVGDYFRLGGDRGQNLLDGYSAGGRENT